MLAASASSGEHMDRLARVITATALMVLGTAAHAASLTPEQTEFRAIYKELVEINTTLSANNCIGAVERDGGAAEVRGIPRCRHPPDRAARSADEEQPRGGAARHRQESEGDSAARAHRRGRSQARRLGTRSVHAGGRGRLLLRSRHRRRQSDGGDLRRRDDALQERAATSRRATSRSR